MLLRFDYRDIAQRAFTFFIVFALAVTAGQMLCGSRALGQEEGKEPLKANEAQKLLLMKDHLSKIKKPSILRYSFERKSQKADDSFKDTIDLKVTKVKESGAKDLSFEFFTGSRKRPYPDVQDFRTNGLVMVSLTRDIWQMARDIGKHAQQANYFGKRINISFRKDPAIEDVELKTESGTIKAKKITLQPFLKDYHVAKFRQFEHKTYEFFFSEDIPGEFYMLRTFVPAGEAEKDAGPQIEEVTKFQEQLPLN